MRVGKQILVVLACFVLSLLFYATNAFSQAGCLPPVQIVGDAYQPTSIQDAYDYASITLGLNSFTLRLSGETFTENLSIDRGTVVLDGGYDCTFATKVSSSGINGTMTISGGAAKFAGGVGIVSTSQPSQCEFDVDLDGFTSTGSCAGSADDCDDNNPDTFPGASEICDGLDNNCDGQVDEGFTPVDADGDGYYSFSSCGGPLSDCNDSDPNINPGALDIPYDGIDQDCDGSDLTYTTSDANFCSDCHSVPNGWASLHDMTTPTDGTCVTCHDNQATNILSGHYGDTVRTAGNNMLAGEIVVCGSCHDASANNHTGGETLGNGSNFVGNKIGRDWPNLTCDTCHETRASLHSTATAHDKRTIDTTCGSCHTSDTTVLGQPGSGSLVNDNDVDSLHGSCATCHSYSGIKLYAAAVNQVIQAGLNGTLVSCTACHTDKGANHGNFDHPIEVGSTDLSAGISCGSCHVVANWAEIEGTEHNVPTNGAGSCATCHNSTRPDVMNVIANSTAPINCLDCHSANAAAHGNVDHVALGYVTGSGTTCFNCHDSGTAANATVTVTHQDNCGLCHTSVPDLQPWLPTGADVNNPNLCTDCHMNSWEATHSLNTPDHTSLVQVQTTECASCHNDPPPLTDAGDPKVHNGCTSCHDADGGLISSAIGENFTSGGNCTNCHGTAWQGSHSGYVHGVVMGTGDLSFTPPGQTCDNCHVVSTWAEIEGVEHNVSTNGAGSCATCHFSARAEVQNAIANGVPPINCLDCHGNKLLTVHGNVDHVGSGYVTGEAACLVCHGDPATIFTNGSDPKVHDDCTTCHDSSTNALIGSAAGNEGGPNTCTSCHTGRDWTDHNIDHATAGYLSLHSECTSCHSNTVSGIGSAFINPANDEKHNACTSCHAADGAITVAVNDCSECHSGVTSDWATHAEDHTGKVTQATGCASCHSTTVDYVSFVSLADNSKHDTCYTCHNSTTKLASAAAGDCSQCHSGVITDFSTHTTNDHTGLVTQATGCATCHSSTVDYANFTSAADNLKHDTCATCHTAGTNAPVATAGDCSQCHNDVTGDFTTHITLDHTTKVTLQSECTGCHNTTVAVPFIDAANVKKHDACVTCHSATTNAPSAPAGDCSQCHTPNYFDNHNHVHTVALGASDLSNGTSCSSCHDDNNGALASWNDIYVEHLSNCATCHSSPRAEVANAILAGANPTNCLTCHSDKTGGHGNVDHTALGYVSVGGSAGGKTCQTCHAIGEPLNGTVMTTHFGDCDTCHTALIPELKPGIPGTPGSTRTCATCHTTSVHHDTVQANQGVCESCHTWPADMNNVPKQMACLGCHGGAYQHGKNADAPIQDFRICMDCHATDGDGSMQGYYSGLATPATPAVPRHGRPAPVPGYPNVSPVPPPNTLSAAAPGRGTFNMQYSVWGGRSNNRDYHKRTVGDDIGKNWPNSYYTMRENPATGYDLRTVINENGTNTTVPYFNNIAAADLLNSCTACHVDSSSLVACDNPNWTNHVGVERSVMELAETTYLGSICVGGGGSDTTAPTVTSFSLPATSASPIPVTVFTASDDTAVTGYMITESSAAPSAGAAGWSSTPPAAVTTGNTGNVTFYAWAKDAAGNVSSSLNDTVNVTGGGGDTTAPTVTAFTLPASSSSPIPVNTFTASDNVAVTGYMITESPSAPTAGAAGWTASAPTSITTSSNGTVVFYAWAKDAAGNVSTSLSDTVDVTTGGGGGNDVDPNGTYIEAENYSQLVSIGSPNLSFTSDASANGSAAMETTNGNTNNTPAGDRLEYEVNFPTGGTYYFWIRLQNSGTGDSAFVGVDGTMVGALTQTVDGAYYWTNNTQTGNNSTSISAGPHTLNIWGRENVFIDGIYITTVAGTPPGLGGSAGAHTGTIPTGATVIDPTGGGSGGGGTPVRADYYVSPSSGTTIASGITTNHDSCYYDPSSAYIQLLSTNIGDMCGDGIRWEQSSPGMHSKHYFNTAYATNTLVTGTSYQVTMRDGGTVGLQLFYVDASGNEILFGNEATISQGDGPTNNYVVDLSAQSAVVPAGSKLGLRTWGIATNPSFRIYLGNPDGRTGNISGHLIVEEAAQ